MNNLFSISRINYALLHEKVKLGQYLELIRHYYVKKLECNM